MDPKIDFFKTIRFRLTLIYSILLFVFCSSFLVIINLYLNNHFTKEPALKGPRLEQAAPIPKNRFSQLAQEEQNRIKQIRLDDLRQIREVSALSLIPFAIISFIGGYLITEKMLDPLQNLNKQISEIEAKNLDAKIDYHGPEDEIGLLIKNFKHMSARLSRSFLLQSQFVQDAAHELKTPLTIIQTNLDTIISDPKASKAELKDAIKKSLAAVDDLNALIEDLLTLSTEEKISKTQVNLCHLIKTQLESLKQRAKDQNVTLDLEQCEETFIIKANEYMLGRALQNIVENGIKYSDPHKNDSKISISVESTKGEIAISISDNGIGIPKSELDNIFERFYRIDKSRSKTDNSFGLGLAIVKKVIEEHQGEISLSSTLKVGTTFAIKLPKK